MNPWKLHRPHRACMALLLAGVLIVEAGCLNSETSGEGHKEGGVAAAGLKQINVTLTRCEVRTFERVVRIQGSVEADVRALVPVRIPGTVQAMFADEGDTVVQGETRLFQIDNIRQRQGVDSARQNLEVARCAQKEREALLDQDLAEQIKADKDYQRCRTLVEKGSISPDQFERQDAEHTKAQARVKHSEALVALSREQVKQAEIALAMAEKDLDDTLIVAPLSGIISKRFLEPGEMGTAGAPAFRIEDPSRLEVSVHVPGEYWEHIKVGETRARLRLNGRPREETVTVSYRGPTIDTRLRTFEVKCRLPGQMTGLCPGQLVETELILEERTGLGLPVETLVRRGSGWLAFVVEQGQARAVEVAPGLETGGWTELTYRAVAEGTPVVNMGQFLLSDGTPVRVVNE